MPKGLGPNVDVHFEYRSFPKMLMSRPHPLSLAQLLALSSLGASLPIGTQACLGPSGVGLGDSVYLILGFSFGEPIWCSD